MQTIEKIFVEPDDEIIFVVEKILRAPTSRVILVIPASSSVVSSVISLKLLSRQLLDSSKLMVMVTDNPTGKKLASKANLVVKDKISMVDKFAWEEALSIKKELQEHKTGIKNELLASRIPEKVSKEDIEKDLETTQQEEVVLDENQNSEENQIELEDREEIDPTPLPDIFGEKPRLKPKMVEIEGIVIVSGGDINELIAEDIPRGMEKKEPLENAEKSYIKSEKRTVVDTSDQEGEEGSSNVIDRRLQNTGPKKGKKKFKKILAILGIIFLITLFISGGVFAYSYWSLSKVDITVTFNQSEGSINETITVSTSAKDIDGNNLIIPGYEVSIEESSSGDGTPTGKKQTGEFARGVIDIRNKSTESAVNLSAGQVLVDISTNLQYELTENVAIPVDQYQRDVPIKAKEFGEKYNIKDPRSRTFKFGGFTTEQLIGYGHRDIAGGTTEDIVIVTADDVQKARTTLETAIKGTLNTNLQKELGKGEKLLEGSERYEEVSFTQSVPTGEEAESFSIDLRMKVTATKLRESDIKSLAEFIIKKSKGATTEAEVEIGDFSIKNIKVNGSKVSFDLYAQGEVNESLKFEELKSNIAGKSLSEAKEYLENLEQIDKVTIVYQPSFIPESWRKIPNDLNRIRFK